MPMSGPVSIPETVMVAPGIGRPSPATPTVVTAPAQAERPAAEAEAQIPARTVIIRIGRIPPIVTQIDAGTVIIRVGVVPIIVGIIIGIIVIAQVLFPVETFQTRRILVIVVVIVIESVGGILVLDIFIGIIIIRIGCIVAVFRFPALQFLLVFLLPGGNRAVNIIGGHHERGAARRSDKSQAGGYRQ